MTDFDPNTAKNNLPPGQIIKEQGIPELGSNFERKLNWKGIAFIATALIVALISLFWATGGFSSKKSTNKDRQDEIVTIPEAPKKTVQAPATNAALNTGSGNLDGSAKMPLDDNTPAIELRRKRTGCDVRCEWAANCE
jgi:hypothetical protein